MTGSLRSVLGLLGAAEGGKAGPGCHLFAALPSPRNVRLLTPLGDPRATLAGLRMYTPYSLPARSLHALLHQSVRLKLTRWTPPSLRLTVSGLSGLEQFIAEVTGEEQTRCAMLLGAPDRLRKLTVQVMRRGGEVLGYLKLPLTDAAGARIEHEASVLRALRNEPSVAPFVPRLLYSGDWSGIPVLFQSVLPGTRGPTRRSELHRKFLEALRSVRQVRKSGHYLVEEALAAWRQTAPMMETGIDSLGTAALEEAGRLLKDGLIPCGLNHGDFAPWNTRVSGGRLLVFDWEVACWEAPFGWDEFHFDVQVRALLGRRPGNEGSLHGTRCGEGVYLLYLVETLRQAVVEGRDRKAAFQLRQDLIERFLRTRPLRIGRRPMQALQPTCES